MGLFAEAAFTQLFPPSPTFTEKNISSLAGKSSLSLAETRVLGLSSPRFFSPKVEQCTLQAALPSKSPLQLRP
jgi:hypothetical protein